MKSNFWNSTSSQWTHRKRVLLIQYNLTNLNFTRSESGLHWNSNIEVSWIICTIKLELPCAFKRFFYINVFNGTRSNLFSPSTPLPQSFSVNSSNLYCIFPYRNKSFSKDNTVNQVTYFHFKRFTQTSQIPKERAAILSEKSKVIIIMLPLTEYHHHYRKQWQKAKRQTEPQLGSESSLLQMSTDSIWPPKMLFQPTQVVLNSVSHRKLEYFTQKSAFPVSLEGAGDLAALGLHACVATVGWSLREELSDSTLSLLGPLCAFTWLWLGPQFISCVCDPQLQFHFSTLTTHFHLRLPFGHYRSPDLQPVSDIWIPPSVQNALPQLPACLAVPISHSGEVRYTVPSPPFQHYHHQVVWIVPSFWNLLPICDYMQPSPPWLTISLLKVPVPCLSLSSAYPGARYTAGNNEFLRSKCETDSFFSRKGEDLGRPEHRTKKNTWFMFWITPSIWGKIHKTH